MESSVPTITIKLISKNSVEIGPSMAAIIKTIKHRWLLFGHESGFKNFDS